MANTAVRRWNSRELLVMRRIPLPQGESSCHVGHNTEAGLQPPFLPETPLQEAENSTQWPRRPQFHDTQ